jgi:hypothetical protein
MVMVRLVNQAIYKKIWVALQTWNYFTWRKETSVYWAWLYPEKLSESGKI